MLRKAELGELAVDFPHQPIAGDFGDDAGGRDRERKAVAFDDGIIRQRKIPQRQPVDQAMVRANVQSLDCPAHGEVGRSQNVELVDLLTTCGGDRPDNPGVLSQSFVKRFTLEGA